MLRLLQLPGVSAVTAATLMAAIGDISRFPTPRHLVGLVAGPADSELVGPGHTQLPVVPGSDPMFREAQRQPTL
jgi:hypothetical protein